MLLVLPAMLTMGATKIHAMMCTLHAIEISIFVYYVHHAMYNS